MKIKNQLTDYSSLEHLIEKIAGEYGNALHGVIISNDTRLNILQSEGIDVNNHTIHGVAVIAEPFIPEEEVQVILS